MKHKDLLGLEFLSPEEILLILDAARSLKGSLLHRPHLKHVDLSGQWVATIFCEPSTRTRSSFEIAAKRMGAETLHVEWQKSSALKGESLLDTIKNLEAMRVGFFVIRHATSGILEPLAKSTRACILNAGDGVHEHPTQALLDLFTIREKKGGFKGLRVVLLGDIAHSRVARSNLWGLAKLGAQVVFCGPPTLIPPSFGEFEKMGVEVTSDLRKALRDADAVNVLRLQVERQTDGAYIPSFKEYFELYGLTEERLKLAKPQCMVLHPGPLNRGVEIASEVADGPQSVILEQVTNGLAIRMAVLKLLKHNLLPV